MSVVTNDYLLPKINKKKKKFEPGEVFKRKEFSQIKQQE